MNYHLRLLLIILICDLLFFLSSDPSSILGGVRLPPDTEIIKYTSSIVGPKIPGTTNRGRKKTISLDSPSVSVHTPSGPGLSGHQTNTPPSLMIEARKFNRTPVNFPLFSFFQNQFQFFLIFKFIRNILQLGTFLLRFSSKFRTLKWTNFFSFLIFFQKLLHWNEKLCKLKS